MAPHQSVLVEEVLNVFGSKKLSVFIDGTLGAGGHAEAILREHPELELFIGIDQDESALKIAKERLLPWQNKMKYFQGNFQHMAEFAASIQVRKVDGILLDIGVSSMQLDEADRGFSFRLNGPLDMRMDKSQPLTAEMIINEWPEEELTMIFQRFGEEPLAKIAARTLVREREKSPITTTFRLKEVLDPIFPWSRKADRKEPVTLIFQALRIVVNGELGALEEVLPQAVELLNPGGRLSIISFHSLEDRRVKQHFKAQASDKWDTHGQGGIFLDKDPVVRIITNKPMTPKDSEIAQNPRSRSSRMRAVEKL